MDWLGSPFLCWLFCIAVIFHVYYPLLILLQIMFYIAKNSRYPDGERYQQTEPAAEITQTQNIESQND